MEEWRSWYISRQLSKGVVGFFETMTKNSEHAAVSLSLHQGADHSAGIEAAQVVVGLTCAHKHNGLAGDVSHGDGCTDLRGGGGHDA